jgi:DNA adenine methylase
MEIIDDLQNLSIDNNNLIIVKPIIKWVGGKTQIIDKIINKFPKIIENYHEIFLGGGSVLLALLSYEKYNKIKINKKIYAYDLNEMLINLYKNIQSNPNELYNEIIKIKEEFNSCEGDIINRKPLNIEEAKTSKESYYYWMRKQYNTITEKKKIKASAIFIFLNKTCFRGLFRESKNGFNVPYGNNKNPNIIDKSHLFDIHNLIKNVIFIQSDFSNSFKNINNNDFIYLDPPYVPENENSFVKYTNNGFDLEQHILLFNLTNELNNFLMSNSNVPLIYEYFPKNKYNIELIDCKRRINSKKPQSMSTEVFITKM